MFNKFFKFLCGYVIITVSGIGAERFINICLRRNIEIWGMIPIDGGIKMCVSHKDFLHIRSVAKKSRAKIKILKKCGLRFLLCKYRKRYVFAICSVFCVVFFVLSTQFVWVVEINGVENSDINGIVKSLDDVGIKSGALKAKLPSGNVSKDAIINNNDNIAWAWVYIEGAKARVEICEQIIPPVIADKSVPCDIVAACDGVIKHCVVKNGEQILRDGDAVKAGDVIVSGRVATYKEGYPEEYMYVHSMADIFAYTSISKSNEYKLYYESKIPTGKKRTKFSAEVFGKMFSLPMRSVKFDNYSTTEKRHELYIPFFGYTGIAFDTIEYAELDVHKEPLSVDTAVEFAKNDLEEKISKSLLNGSELIDEAIEYEQTDNETIKVKLQMNFVQNIAITSPISNGEEEGEEIFDKQTN